MTDPGWHALVHATVVAGPGQALTDATIVLRDGTILAVGSDTPAPLGAVVHDCSGLIVFAGLIDPHVPVEAAPPATGSARHWNPNVRAEVDAATSAGLEDATRRELRALGYGAVALAPSSGIFRGTATVALLDDDDPRTNLPPRDAILVARAYHSIDLAPGSVGRDPNSLMGAVALIRQTLLDADGRADSAEALVGPSPALAALAPDRDLPLWFQAHDELDVLRAAKLGTEFGRRLVVEAAGTEFRRLGAIVAAKVPLIVPLAFPSRPNVERPGDLDRVSLRDLMTWEQAATNPRRLDAASVPVALTTDRLADRKLFPGRVREAIAAGLPAARALAMLTTVPASLLGVDERLGTITPGKLANLVVVRGADASHPFARDNVIVETWVRGRCHPTEDRQAPLEGTWEWTAQIGSDRAVTGELTFARRGAELRVGDKKTSVGSYDRHLARVSFLLPGEAIAEEGVLVLTGRLEAEALHGTGRTAPGVVFAWQARRLDGQRQVSTPDATLEGPVPEELPMPFGAFGFAAPPVPRDCVVEHTTIWTVGPAGIVEDATLIVRSGKIDYVGPTATAPAPPAGALLVDGHGKHVTPGLIDCHSHTGIAGGVNESGQAVTAEVRIADVLDPDDINFYRQLAGGLTCANLLHGSANPIGGQNAVIKLRWGCAHPDDMLLAGAPGGIKFALGENPKRSRSREEVTRYPRTRLGVEALIRDRFVAAREYARHRGETPTAAAPRDLELEALAEVLAGERLVHCHSYRQDEILMLCRVAKDFGFRIGTFQHVLEGYKVADEIAAAARGASTFSDWWAYKFEVFDAIPDNGVIMRDAGANVSFNSDSSELARRLHAEAGKALKYGRLPPAEALAFVTLNPAIQLGVDDRVGSLEVGKDADFAVWSGEPLRTTTRCEMTFVDGLPLFDRARDARLRQRVAVERARIVQKVLRTPKESDAKNERAQSDDVYDCGECGCGETVR
ncbi:MAG: amidohydrolase family protein [Planctomycetota bacterium]